MTCRVSGLALIASTLTFALVGCNTLLDNNPGTPIDTDEAGTLPDPTTQPTSGDPSQVPGSDAGGSAGCPAGQQTCFGTCVSMLDPVYGCGDPSCAPCASPHATTACQGRQCVVSACEPGYANCNAKAADGCEVDLSQAKTCGSCNAACGASAQLCAPLGPSFQCTSACAPGAPLQCGAECVDPQTSVNHCGGCSTKCAAVANATTMCNAGACGFACAIPRMRGQVRRQDGPHVVRRCLHAMSSAGRRLCNVRERHLRREVQRKERAVRRYLHERVGVRHRPAQLRRVRETLRRWGVREGCLQGAWRALIARESVAHVLHSLSS